MPSPRYKRLYTSFVYTPSRFKFKIFITASSPAAARIFSSSLLAAPCFRLALMMTARAGCSKQPLTHDGSPRRSPRGISRFRNCLLCKIFSHLAIWLALLLWALHSQNGVHLLPLPVLQYCSMY